MPQDFFLALEGENEVNITVVKGKGETRTVPVWFTLEGRTLELLPMYGMKTKWFRDAERSGSLEVEAKKARFSALPRIVRDSSHVEVIKKRFAAKYGVGDVKKYYPTSDVALEVQI